MTGWWFGTCIIFPHVGNNHPNWLIFFRGVGIPPTRYGLIMFNMILIWFNILYILYILFILYLTNIFVRPVNRWSSSYWIQHGTSQQNHLDHPIWGRLRWIFTWITMDKYIYIYIWLVVSNIFYFPFHIWANPSHWLIFFKMVKTTNQICTYIYIYIYIYIYTESYTSISFFLTGINLVRFLKGGSPQL